MRASLPKPFIWAVASALCLLTSTGRAGAQWMLTVAGGASTSADSDVRLRQPGGTDLRLRDVVWTDDSTNVPPYWEAQLIWWSRKYPSWGISVSVTHPKIRARLDRQAEVSGTRRGLAVTGAEAVGQTFGRLEFSDGHNFVMLNGLRRWRLRANTTAPRRTQPYVGLGVGFSYPHVEIDAPDVSVFEYQYAGPAARALVGVDVPLSKKIVSLIVQAKLNYADMSTDLSNHGSVDLEPWTGELSVGLGFRFGKPGL